MRCAPLLAAAFLGFAAAASAGGAAAQEVPLDSIARLPGAGLERDTASLLSTARLARLPATARAAWQGYIRRSRRLEARDRAFMAAELRAAGMTKMVRAPYTHDFGMEPHMAGAWFAGDSARRIADNILSWQTPAGGWSKHVPMRLRTRQPGESWYSESDQWRYIGTFDNDATVTQLRILGGVADGDRAAAKAGSGPGWGSGGARYRVAFLHGLAYIRAAQYPNGCFPQVYPLQGGYHDAATYNDNATVNILRLLRDVAGGRYAFVPPAERRRARGEFRHGLDCVLRSQVVVNGRRTIWAQQHDPITLAPAPARSYELVGLSGRESAWLLDFLMELPAPGPRVVAAVHAGVAWFRAHEIHDSLYDDGLLKASPGAPPLWARNTEVETGRPIMANRDGIRLYDTARLTDRRHGYGWFGTEPAATLKTYERWAREHPREEGTHR